MKKLITYVAFIALGTSFIQNTIKTESFFEEIEQESEACMSRLENEIHYCIQKYIPTLRDLSIKNLFFKKPHIESLKKELLNIIQSANADERKEYKNLEQTLKSFNVSEIFKLEEKLRKIENSLPVKTKVLLSPYIARSKTAKPNRLK